MKEPLAWQDVQYLNHWFTFKTIWFREFLNVLLKRINLFYFIDIGLISSLLAMSVSTLLKFTVSEICKSLQSLGWLILHIFWEDEFMFIDTLPPIFAKTFWLYWHSNSKHFLIVFPHTILLCLSRRPDNRCWLGSHQCTWGPLAKHSFLST